MGGTVLDGTVSHIQGSKDPQLSGPKCQLHPSGEDTPARFQTAFSYPLLYEYRLILSC